MWFSSGVSLTILDAVLLDPDGHRQQDYQDQGKQQDGRA